MELTDLKTPSAFVSALSDYFLSSIDLAKEGPVYAALNRALTELEISLSEGGLCAQISRDDASLLLKASLATDISTAKENEEIASPLIYADNENIYLHRDYEVERNLAKRLYDFVAKGLGKNPKNKETPTNTLTLVKDNALSVIYGGPGTGKTSSLANILEDLFRINPNLTVFLGAPTGKASARMHEALVSASQKNHPLLAEKLKLSENSNLLSRTIHKWLYTAQETGEKPSEENPLACDVFVLDEASMLDARLAAQLLRVIDAEKTKLLFLGDAYQLRSVGPGSLFADLCALGRNYGFAIELKKSFRFDPNSAVGKMAFAINSAARKNSADSPANKSEPALCASPLNPTPVSLYLYNDIEENDSLIGLLQKLGLSDSNDVDLHFLDTAHSNTDLPIEVKSWIDDRLNHYADLIKEGDENRLFTEAQRFRILCATREGNLSVASVNAYAREALRNALLKRGFEIPARTGEMIIVTKNDDATNLFNGDMGIILPAGPSGITEVLFRSASEELRHVPLSLLPEYESAFAITIHKSQGSEYEDLALLLPRFGAETLLSNELLYTAITRVKDRKDSENRIVQYGKLSIFTSVSSLEKALSSYSARKTGLKNRLCDIFKKDEGKADDFALD